MNNSHEDTKALRFNNGEYAAIKPVEFDGIRTPKPQP
jgi:hypothetical protein